MVLDLVDKGLVTDQLVLTIGYDIENLSNPNLKYQYKGEVTIDRYGRKVPKHAHATAKSQKDFLYSIFYYQRRDGTCMTGIVHQHLLVVFRLPEYYAAELIRMARNPIPTRTKVRVSKFRVNAKTGA